MNLLTGSTAIQSKLFEAALNRAPELPAHIVALAIPTVATWSIYPVSTGQILTRANTAQVFFSFTPAASLATATTGPAAKSIRYAAVMSVIEDANTLPLEEAAYVDEPWSLDSVRDEYEFARTASWDDAEAEPITDEVIVNAKQFFASLPVLPTPSEVSPLSDGALSFVWDLATGYLFIGIGPRAALHVYYDIPGLGKWERITSLDSQAARESTLSAIRALTRTETGPRHTRTAELPALLAA
jgi:hypothetical protein